MRNWLLYSEKYLSGIEESLRSIKVIIYTTYRRNVSRLGKRELVLIEGRSKRGEKSMSGRTDGGIVVHIEEKEKKMETGDYVVVKVCANRLLMKCVYCS